MSSFLPEGIIELTDIMVRKLLEPYSLHAQSGNPTKSAKIRLPKQMRGQIAVVKHALKSSGSIKIAGELYAAKTKTGYIAQGSNVRIIGNECGELIVEPLTDRSPQ